MFNNYLLFHKISLFLKDKNGVIGLPMRLTVSIIIGTVALISILSFFLNPCLFPDKMIVTISPNLNEIPIGNDTAEFNFTISVFGSEGQPIKNANVIIKGLSGIGSSFTDENGITTVQIFVELDKGRFEGYLDVSVKAACHETFSQRDMIKIIRSS